MTSNAVVCKTILLGNGSVGKTSICSRFQDDGFRHVYRQTVGIDFYEKEIQLRGKRILLQVWDIGGQGLTSSMLPKYVSGAAAAFICYDVTDAQSFADAEDWHAAVVRTIEKVQKPLSTTKQPSLSDETGGDDASSSSSNTGETMATNGKAPSLYLVGNKVDLQHLRKVSAAAHEKFISSHCLDGGFFTSARSGEAILTAFYTAAASALGLHLTEAELEMTKKVLGIVLAEGGASDQVRTTFADDIEKADREAQAKRDAGGIGRCCAIQ